MAIELLFTCEHASRDIPPEYEALFADQNAILATHRGWDIGTPGIFQQFVNRFQCPNYQAQWSRLLCDVNRSAWHKSCFSEFTRELPSTTRQHILDRYHTPYRQQVIEHIDQKISQNKTMIHISVHSFTPELNGKIRNAEIGFLYDPKSIAEKSLCIRWKNALQQVAPDLRVRFNYPYLGISDGLTQFMRRRLKSDRYAGIELEMNQALTGDVCLNQRLQSVMIDTFMQVYDK